MKIRILPLIIVTAFVMVMAKSFELVTEKAGKAKISAISAIAQDQLPAAQEDVAKAEAKEETKAAEDGTPTTAANEEKPVLSPNYSGGGPKELDVTNLSDMEKSLLENLAKRRKELEDWSASIELKENVLNATEKKINLKMEELEKLKTEVASLLGEYNEKENKKIQRLVKIYENMKPQEAANIFSEMDMAIALDVFSKMKEDAAAKILAKMPADKAKDLTEKLAMQRKLVITP